jgi:hypothetical protein
MDRRRADRLSPFPVSRRPAIPQAAMHPPDSTHPALQVLWLFILSIPVSCVAWTVTHEEIFREPREFCLERSKACRKFLERKFFYLFTCEYCFSHYVTVLFLFLTHYKLLLDDWRGYMLSLFALVFISNVYMSLYGRLKVATNVDRAELKVSEKRIEQIEAGKDGHDDALR